MKINSLESSDLMENVKNLVFKFGDGLRTIIAKMEADESFMLSETEANFCIDAYAEMKKLYRSLTIDQKKIINKKITELTAVHGALDSFSDRSEAIYAYDGLLAFNELLNQKT